MCYLKMLLGKVSRNLLENTCDGVCFSKVTLNFTHKNIPLQVFSVNSSKLLKERFYVTPLKNRF